MLESFRGEHEGEGAGEKVLKRWWEMRRERGGKRGLSTFSI
jgi:hypothetical protein